MSNPNKLIPQVASTNELGSGTAATVYIANVDPGAVAESYVPPEYGASPPLFGVPVVLSSAS